MFREEDAQLKTQRYVGLSSVLILLLVLMFFVINLTLFMRKANEELESQQFIPLEQNDQGHNNIIVRKDKQDYFFTLVTRKDSLVEDGLKKAKVPYDFAQSLKDIKQPQGHIILDGAMLKDPSDLNILKKFIDNKKTIILLSMPELSYIKDNEIEAVLGIATITKEEVEQQLNLVPGFMLGGFHEFKDMAYKRARVNLLATTKTYGFGEDKVPIIWRNTYKGSELYVVNGPFMETNASYGILSALMGEIYENYIYPIINARLMTYDGFPYLSYENTQNLEEIYNRDAMKLQNDILLPDILTINKRREFIPNGYLIPGFNVRYTGELEDYNINQIKSAQIQLYKEGGQVGIRYTGDLEYDKKIYQTIFPEADITSIMLRESTDNIEELLGVSEALESILGPWTGTKAFDYLDKDTVYIPYTMNGTDKAGQENLEFISGVTAFGAAVQNLSLEEVVMVEGERDRWKPISHSYMEFLDAYRQQFDFLENRNVTKTARATQVFINSAPEIKISSNRIRIRFEHWKGKSHYILRTNKKIKSIVNGSIELIEEGAYLITATDKEVEIDLRD